MTFRKKGGNMFMGKRIRAIAFFTAAIFLGFTLTLEYSFAQEKKKAAQVMGSQQVNSSIEENSEMVRMGAGENGENAEFQPLVLEKIEKSPQLKKKKKFPWLWALLGAGAAAAVLIVLIIKKKNPSGPYMNGVLTVNGVRYELASIPAGEFQMGKDSSAHPYEKPVHTVRISKGFWLGKTEVTQGLWRAVMGNNPAQFPNGDNYPVEYVSWDDCQAFI
jgi:formylglycine-generating enzyme required for sulfatase activity